MLKDSADGNFECKFYTFIRTNQENATISPPGLPLARKFPCKRKFGRLQGKVQGNKMYKEMARKF
jgi:hypothetical protein